MARIARRHGVGVKHVSNWGELAERLADHHGIAHPAPGSAKRYCYEVMECLGWIARCPEVPA
ncbi:hypothetical protein [Paracoccus siganidrum]|uniref:hypothetical protein n=1 Tax=Paracoccus siganidrum TaxID=1276757 RepID=UPI0011C38993|nr:hypothetical protein [Paracoccus siganidrum]